MDTGRIGFVAEVEINDDSRQRIEDTKSVLALFLRREKIHPSIGTGGLALAAFL